MMYEATEEYEDIDMDSTGIPLIPGMGGPVKMPSPSKRPPMPLPGSLQEKCTLLSCLCI